MVRSHLNEIGHIVSDADVESMITRVKKNFNVTTQRLKKELARENITFDEYFELLRASREYDLFLNFVIYPLVSISDHQIKSYFFQHYSKDNPLTVMYDLTSYSIARKKVKKKDLKNLSAAIEQYASNGVLPQKIPFNKKSGHRPY